MTPVHVCTATWIEDGFFFPRASVAMETKNEQGVRFVPVDGLEAHAQFFVVRVGEDALVAVIGANAQGDREVVRAALHARHPITTCGFIEDDRIGYARVTCEWTLSVALAIAVATVRCGGSWDESEVIVVTDGVVRHDVRIAYEMGIFSATTR